MDTTTLSHVAAILVGVLVTLALVGGLSSNNSKEAASASAASANKKKKKKKTKGSSNGETETAAAVTEKAAAPANKKKNKKGAKVAPAPAPAPKARAAPVVSDSDDDSDDDEPVVVKKATNGDKKKKKKGPAAATNGAKPKATTAAAVKDSDDEDEDDDPPKAQAETTSWQTRASNQQQQQQEVEWTGVPVNKKKKNKAQRPKPAAAATATATPATATPATSTDSVTVDAKKIGIIIGPKGATMQAIQEATGCQLDINAPPKDDKNPSPTATVVVSGPDKDSLTKAKKAITELATKGYATILQNQDGNFGEYSVSVHPRHLSEIVGPGGKTIQALQKTLDVKITIPPTDWKPNSSNVDAKHVTLAKVGIAGSKENCKTAKAAIQFMLNYHHHEITHPGLIHEEIYVPGEFFHCVIGPRGSEIKHIRGNYKVEVYMPNEESVTENVLVVGHQTNVDKAISYIQLLMDRDTEQRNRKYNSEYY